MQLSLYMIGYSCIELKYTFNLPSYLYGYVTYEPPRIYDRKKIKAHEMHKT